MRVIDPLSHVRSHPEMYLPEGQPRGRALAHRIAGDPFLFGAENVLVTNDRGWWAVFADVDWLSTDPTMSPADLFKRAVPFPEAGVNSLRSEILVTAYADEVVIGTPHDREVIKGEAVSPQQLPQPPGHFRWSRMVAFRTRT
jgi:hypothetical protein